tara:strand:+ start:222 stop:482 length:261 start_codon:yes stop_codon:yes gene_type:complete
MGQLMEILDGWGNVIKSNFGLLDEGVRSLAEKRLLHCNVCSTRTGNTCDPSKKILNENTNQYVYGCGCNISAKTLSSETKCPAGKW